MLELQRGGCGELTVMIQAANYLRLGWVAIIPFENFRFLTDVIPRSYSGRVFLGLLDIWIFVSKR